MIRNRATAVNNNNSINIISSSTCTITNNENDEHINQRQQQERPEGRNRTTRRNDDTNSYYFPRSIKVLFLTTITIYYVFVVCVFGGSSLLLLSRRMLLLQGQSNYNYNDHLPHHPKMSSNDNDSNYVDVDVDFDIDNNIDNFANPINIAVTAAAAAAAATAATATATATAVLLSNTTLLAVALPGGSNTNNIILDLPPPIFGKHRRRRSINDFAVDAVFTFARGYKPPSIIRFVSSLINTGYNGDIVLGIDYDSMINDLVTEKENNAIQEYLIYYSKYHNLVVHDIKLICNRSKPGRGGRGDELCTAPYMYRYQNQNQNNQTKNEYLSDPRIQRHVSQLRYEYYWAWSKYYYNSSSSSSSSARGSKGSRIFLSDLRDVYFQKNPFSLLVDDNNDNDSNGNNSNNKTMINNMDHTLQVFVEDTKVYDLFNQRANSHWIRDSGRINGPQILEEIGHNTSIVCSGTTLGGSIAIESYLRAMIYEFDLTQCIIVGCDQGHHNYLLYTNKLFNVPTLLLKVDDSISLTTTIITMNDNNNNNNSMTTTSTSVQNLIGDDYYAATSIVTNNSNSQSNSETAMILKIIELTTSSTNKNRKRKKIRGNRIERIEFISQGYGAVNALGMFCGFRSIPRRKRKEYDNDILQYYGLIKRHKEEKYHEQHNMSATNRTKLPIVLNWDGSVSPVIHQFDRCSSLANKLNQIGDELWSEWKLKV